MTLFSILLTFGEGLRAKGAAGVQRITTGMSYYGNDKINWGRVISNTGIIMFCR